VNFVVQPTTNKAENRNGALGARTMAGKYVQEFKVPEGFPEILRDFTRELLRDQPKEIEKYGFDYFKEKLKSAPPPAAAAAPEGGDPSSN
jgi:hypothetical protein